MPRRALNPAGLPPPPMFSRGVEVSGQGKLVFLAGAAPLNDENEVAGPDMTSQAEACFSKISQILAEAGGTMSDIVFLNVYVTDMSRFGELRSVREKYLTGPVYPAMSGYQVAALASPEWLIEVDGVAFVEQTGTNG